MKRKTLITLLLTMVACVGLHAQTVTGYFKVTADNIYIRKGPGKNYGFVKTSGARGTREGVNAKTWKGMFVESNGKRKNGYVYVTEVGPDFYWAEDGGWIPQQYLVKATQCPTCKGSGNTGRQCPECGGQGFRYCCLYTGMEQCTKCGGVGYK